mmetsp:Transcript_22095/g.86876  ORF Transcript_22095/g.86876 Transcript_22095/m.86876 type:complete len:208 (+) Transcript_22095:539-1162(+)
MCAGALGGARGSGIPWRRVRRHIIGQVIHVVVRLVVRLVVERGRRGRRGRRRRVLLAALLRNCRRGRLRGAAPLAALLPLRRGLCSRPGRGRLFGRQLAGCIELPVVAHTPPVAPREALQKHELLHVAEAPPQLDVLHCAVQVVGRFSREELVHRHSVEGNISLAGPAGAVPCLRRQAHLPLLAALLPELLHRRRVGKVGKRLPRAG